MLNRFKVKGFKSLVDLDLELGRINVFIGANGSGKSNLLEALGLIGAAAFGRVDDEALQRRGVRPGVPQLYTSAFPRETEKAPHIVLEARSVRGATFSVTLSNPQGDSGTIWRFKKESLWRADGNAVFPPDKTSKHDPEQGLAALKTAELDPPDAALDLMTTLRHYGIYGPNTPVLRGIETDAQAREPVGLAGGRLPEAVAELLDAARTPGPLRERLDDVRSLIDWASDFSSAPSVDLPLSPAAARSRQVIRFVDRFMAKGRNTLTGYDASEGALHVLFCAVLALHPKAPHCLAIDNLDQALNPRMACRLMEAVCDWTKQAKGRRQWLVTAHNPAVLDGLPLGDPDVRLFAVDRDSHGHSTVRRIDLAAAVAKRPSDEWTLSRMWMTGLLGAVPNV